LSLCLTKHYAMNAYGGSGCIDPRFYDLGNSARGTHLIEGWVGPRGGLDDMEKCKFLPLWDSNPYPSVIQPVVSRYTEIPWLSALKWPWPNLRYCLNICLEGLGRIAKETV
jgi:hypothetical protein